MDRSALVFTTNLRNLFLCPRQGGGSGISRKTASSPVDTHTGQHIARLPARVNRCVVRSQKTLLFSSGSIVQQRFQGRGSELARERWYPV